MTDGWGISGKIALRWMPLDLTIDKSILVQVMVWCRQATSHYLSQCWPRSMSPYDITRPQWVNNIRNIKPEHLSGNHQECFIYHIKYLSHADYCGPFSIYRSSFHIYSHHRDKMVMMSSYLYIGNPYTDKTASLSWNGLLRVQLTQVSKKY